MVLMKEDAVKVESDLYAELRKQMGKNFDLFAQTVQLVEWKRKGPYQPPAQKLGSTKHALAFPPLLNRWSSRQTKEVVKDTGKVIRLNQHTLEQLNATLGEKFTGVLRDNIGFDERPNRDGDVKEREIPVFRLAWGKDASIPEYELNGTWANRQPHPIYKDSVSVSDMATIKLGTLDDDRRNLVGVGARVVDIAKFRPKHGSQAPHATKVNGKFYWPHMTNPIAHIPVKVHRANKVTDLTAWLSFYGEPHPDKIPTGTMTTFEPLQKIVAGGKSQCKNAVTKVDGRTWKKEFELVRHRSA